MTQMMPNMWTMILNMKMIMIKTTITENHFLKLKKTEIKYKLYKSNW